MSKEPTAAERAERIMTLDKKIAGFLAEQPPEDCGAVLGELVSRWLAGHAPSYRDVVWAHWQELVMDLVNVQELIIFGPEGHPARQEEEHGEKPPVG